MKKRGDKKTEVKILEENKQNARSSKIYDKNTDDHSNDSAVAAHADLVKEHGEKATKVKNVVSKQLGIDQNDKESISKRQKTLKLVMSITFIVFVFGVFTFTFYNDFFATDKDFPSWEVLGDILKNSWQYFLYAVISLALYYIFKGAKLSLMCKSLTGKFKYKTCLETGIIGMYYNCVTPLAVGGQPFEIYHLSKHGVHGGAASAMPIATFFMNQFAFVSLGIASLVLFKTNVLEIPSRIINAFPTVFTLLAMIGLSCCMIMPLLVILFSMMPKFGAKVVTIMFNVGAKLRLVKNPKETTLKTIKNLFHNATCLKKVITNPFSFLLNFLLSVGERLAEASIAYFALRMFGYDLVGVSATMEWLQVVQIATILYAGISFIPTPGNSGAADLSFYLLFEVGLFAGLAFPAMVIWRVLSFYSHIIIGFLFTTAKRKADHAREKQNLPLE